MVGKACHWNRERRDDVTTRGKDALRDVDEVGACLFYQAGNDLGLLELQAAWHKLHRAHAVDDGEVRSNRCAHRRDDLGRKACAIDGSATILVATLVGIRGGKLVDEVAVGAMDLHAIKACGLGADGSVHEALLQCMDFVNCQRMGSLPNRGILDSRGRHALYARHATRRLTPGMIELHDNLRASIVDALGKRTICLHLFVVPQPAETLESTGFRAHAEVLRDDGTKATTRLALVIGHELLGRHTILAAIAAGHG